MIQRGTDTGGDLYLPNSRGLGQFVPSASASATHSINSGVDLAAQVNNSTSSSTSNAAIPSIQDKITRIDEKLAETYQEIKQIKDRLDALFNQNPRDETLIEVLRVERQALATREHDLMQEKSDLRRQQSDLLRTRDSGTIQHQYYHSHHHSNNLKAQL